MSLFKRRFREELNPLLTWGSALLLSGIALMLMSLIINEKELAKSFADVMNKMPDAVKNMFGGNVFENFSYRYLLSMAFDTIAPILFMVYASQAVLGLYTKEAGHGNLEFLFSLPVERFRIVFQRTLVLLLDLTILLALFMLGLIVGAFTTNLKLDYAALAGAAASFLLFTCFLSGLAFLLSLNVNDYSRGILLVLGVLLGLFVLNVGVGETAGGLANIKYINPFHYYNAARIFENGTIPWGNMLAFTLIGLVSWGAGMYWYTRKQI